MPSEEIRASLMPILGLCGTTLIAVCLLIWYRAKAVIHRKGYPTRLFYAHLRDYGYLKKIISAETDSHEKKKYEKILWQMYFLWILFILAVVCLIGIGVLSD